MLPTTGFFKDIECPYYEKSCVRPYCHFRHRKRSQEPPQESPPLPPDEPLVIPTYKPTPKSELASTKSHIPISYVPDLVIRSDRNLRPIPSFNLADRPTYKPTPISILSSTNVSKVCEYTPTNVVLDDSKEDINLEDLTTEFNLIDEILEDDDPKKEKPDKKESGPSKPNPKDKKREKEKSKTKDSDKAKVKHKEKSSSKEKEVKHRKDKYSNSSGSSSKGKLKERDKDKDSESEEIKYNKNRDKQRDSESEEIKHKNRDKHKDRESEDAKNRRSKEKEEVKHKEKEQDIKSKRDKDKNKEKGRDRDKEKLREKEQSNSDREREKIREKEQSYSDKHKSKERKEKEQIHVDKDKNKVRKEKEQVHNNREKHKEQIHNDRDKNKERKEIHGEKDKNKDRKEKEQVHNSREKHKDHNDREKNKDRKDNYKYKNKEMDSDKEKHKNRDRREKDKNRDRKSEKHEKSRIKQEKLEPIVEWNSTDDFEVNFMMDEEDDEMDSIEAECYKIFNEYTPPIMEEKYEPMPTEPSEVAPEPYNPTCKKRIAYDNANQSSSKISYNKPKPVTNMSIIMLNRLKQARQAQTDNYHRDLLAELNKPTLKRAPEVELSANKRFAGSTAVNGKPKPKPSPSSLLNPGKPVGLVDEILSGRSATKPRRIAPAQNVNLIQRAKAQFDAMVKTKAAQVLKTQAQTAGKGNKRVAHVPDASLSDLPDVLHAERSKLPVNVRTRYLTMLADECIKLYLFKDDAYQRALNEELKCYEKCSVLTTYRNSAMLAINRLRKEIQEREKDGLDPIQPGEDDERAVDSPLQGKRFYESIQSFILTEDELVLHGYPREGPEPGRAIITSDSRVVSDNMDENQRICCRCHKHYLVDDDGLPVVTEDCVYHPLRKRTLRGERTYLCCKSTDDAGCAMSNTHVSEVSADRELEGYQSTLEPSYEEDQRNYAVYALDCEMCYTTTGLELTRVTIVDTNLKTIYESLVKPLNPIIDYNTRFSGITKDQMDRTSTSILQVQANILHLCNSKTILIGHSLESDMKALKIIHSNIIDTSVMFPHKFGLPHKRALRVLASEYLRKIIQNGTDGHDSAEDALTCMELVIWKVKEDMKVKGAKG